MEVMDVTQPRRIHQANSRERAALPDARKPAPRVLSRIVKRSGMAVQYPYGVCVNCWRFHGFACGYYGL